MPIPTTKVYLDALLADGLAARITPNAAADFSAVGSGAWVSGLADITGDGIADIVIGAPGDDDKDVDAGRIFVLSGANGMGATGVVTTAALMIIDGVSAGDLSGATVGAIADLNGGGNADILIGAPGTDIGAQVDAGAAYVIWSTPGSNVDLGDPFNGDGKGFVIKGELAGDAAGSAITSIADLNGDGKADILVGAPGQDAGGADAGAAYVVWGKSSSSAVNLSSVAAGTGGFKIMGDSPGDGAGGALGTVADLNGDGKAELLIGAAGSQIGGADSGAVYVVFGKGSTAAVDLSTLASSSGGFVIKGAAGDLAGTSVAGLGDVNGDGMADILMAAPGSDSAYVVFGKSDAAAIDLSVLSDAHFRITAEQPGDLAGMTVAGGRDFNHDGINDIVIGAPHDSEGGFDAGAVYIVWGGGSSNIDLSLIAQDMGGAKIVGTAGSLTGSSLAITDDLNSDGTADLVIGAPGAGESAWVVTSQASWQPDTNVYGTNGDDVIGAGFGGAHIVGEGADNIVALAGNDSISSGGGNDTIDDGADDDTMSGGGGDDAYYIDSTGDTVTEASGEGTDTEISTVHFAVLADNVERLGLAGFAQWGTGNALDNTIVGSDGNDIISGEAGADTMTGGLGDDAYVVDSVGDVVVEFGGGGIDTVYTELTYVLGDEVEALVFNGFGQSGTGNALNNTISGSDGNDTIDGAAGADSMEGWLGDDLFMVDNAADVVSEQADSGADTVVASVNYTLSADVEELILAGAARMGTGNALDNHLTGTAGNDSLDGGAGADTMKGGAGDDTYTIDNAGDVVVEADGAGNDTVIARFDYTLGEGSIENLILSGAAHHATGNSGANVLTGTAGEDWLDGGAGVDTLSGGAGNDNYIVDSATDTIIEQAGGGTDAVESSIDFSLAGIANVENLVLTGDAHHGTGSDGDNRLTGNAGADLLEGGLGADTLDGGAGADTLDGGAGNDTYFVDNASDVVIEAAGDGVDTVIINSDWTLADNVENVVLVGSGHTLTGNAANNSLSGDTGDDILDGGDGDDTELGGDGDDVLISGAGHDTLAGGAGDDVYRIHGGAAHIEDFQGHDTIDASEATGDSHIDLSGDTASEIENEICDLGTGGTVTGALNVQFLQDLTGSFGDDIANVRVLVPQIVTALQGVSGGAAFGVSTFRDKAYGAFGGAGDWVYVTALGMGATASALTTAYNGFVAYNGADEPEAQIEALMQLAMRANGEVGFQSNSARFAVVFTDAHFHTAADGTAGGITTPNNGDAIIDNGGILENYPLVAQVRAALEAANVIPIFAVTTGLETTYQGLVTDLGRGTVVTLSSNSANIVSAIATGLTTATTTHIAAAIGGAGNDTLAGNVGANELTGGAGNDELKGGAGDDAVHGGTGSDTAQFSGSFSDYAITHNPDDSITVSDNRPGSDGTDTLDGVEFLRFGTALYTAAGVSVAPPALVDDTATGLIEAGSANIGVAAASGNVLSNDVINVTPGVVSGAHAGAGGAFVAVSGATMVDGTYGVLTINPDGSFNYALDNARAATEALSDGQAVADLFTYQVTDALGQSATATLSLAITGASDAPATVVTTSTDKLLVTSGVTSALDAAILLGNDGATNGESLTVTSVSNAVGASVALVGGKLAIAATGAASFDYTATSTTGATAVGHVTVATVSTDAAANRVTVGAIYTGSDVSGQDGNDALTGAAGRDHLIGGNGNDFISGGTNADTMEGGLGSDSYTVDNVGDAVIEGNDTGNDLVTASVSFVLGANIERLTLSGTAATDGTGNELANTLIGNAGANLLTGFDGADILSGGAGSDTLDGGAGNDRLDGGLGADAMSGGQGDDSYTVDDLGDTVSEGFGEGNDLVSASVSFVLGANIERLTLSGTAAIDGTGNELANTLIGNAGANLLTGFDGADILSGGAGSDTLDGGAGNDRLDGGLGADALIGGQGDDSYTVDDLGDTVSEGFGEGNDLVSASVSFVLGTNFERLTLSGTAAIDGTGNELANTLIGNAADNVLGGLDGHDTLLGGIGNDGLFGGEGNDLLSGGTGNDTLDGGTGNDRLDGGLGADAMSGGSGDDSYTVDDAGDTVTEALDAGNDFVLASVSFVTGANVERLSLSGTAAIDGTGNELANALLGNAGANHLFGLDGADILTGGDGSDTLDGGTGNDRLDGGLGADMLTGGLGRDTFAFAATAASAFGAPDTITDFSHAEKDVIQLTAIDPVAGGVNEAFLWGGTTAKAFGVWYQIDSGAGVTHVYGDADGNSMTAELAIDLIGTTPLVQADFML